MNPTTQALDCPVCNGKIYFDPKQLVLGVQFKCSACGASVGLSPDSRPMVDETLKKFEKLKDRLKE